MWDHIWHETLNPLDFLERSASVYADKAAVVYKDRRYTYGEFYARVNQLAGALKQAGMQKGDRVAFLVPNVPAMLEGHYGPLRLGAILVAINIRLSPREVAYILNHSGAKALVFDAEFAPTVRAIRDEIKGVSTVVQVVDTMPKADDIPGPDYESFLAAAPAGDHRVELDSEKDTICINYTSGTTGMPKGVQYHARGAYLNALGEALEVGLNYKSRYL
jgi:fatty-acyl-CoA synthase